MLRYIWQRYFFKETVKIFLLFLGCFYFVYALIDFSTHMQDFIQNEQAQIASFFTYYGNQFIKRADILVPLALLISCVKVLLTLNTRRELLALQTAGMKIRTLLSPFFLLASLVIVFMYCNFQFFLPSAANSIDQFHLNFGNKAKKGEEAKLHTWYLNDGSKIIYQNLDEEKNAYFDVIWVRSAQDIWRMKYLSSDPSKPIGQYVDHIQKNLSGRLVKTESYATYHFPDLQWGHRMIEKQAIPTDNLSLSRLGSALSKEKNITFHKKAETLTYLLYKLAMPLLSLLIVMGISPFCIRYARNTPVYLIYAAGIFGYIVFYVSMDAAIILGKNQVLSPFLVILTPLGLAGSWSYYQFRKQTK